MCMAQNANELHVQFEVFSIEPVVEVSEQSRAYMGSIIAQRRYACENNPAAKVPNVPQ